MRHTDTAPKEKPTGSANNPAGHTDTKIVVEPADADNKAFATLAARYALAGHSLVRSTPAQGGATFYAMRWGMIRPLPDLVAAERFLELIGGTK